MELSAKVHLRRQASPFDPYLFSDFRKVGGAVSVFTTHIHEILGSGEPDFPAEIQNFLGYRPGTLKLQESSLVHVGMELSQEGGFSANLAREHRDFRRRDGRYCRQRL